VSFPIVVVQHLPATAELNLELVFGRYFQGRVLEAMDKMPAEPGCAYFAPPGYHLLVERDLSLALTQDEPVHHSRPSIDVLFESAAWSLGPEALGILLTGANADGVNGLEHIHRREGLTIVQSPLEAEFPYMPEAAIERFQPSHVFTLEEIARFLSELSGKGGTR
jgi:two-component system, chemotaxis family, protein-glutamate methylesterase/glutaminase